MATKTITIMDDAYRALAQAKREGESFSDTIRRITKPSSIMDHFGAWKGMGTEILHEHIAKRREENRKRSEMRVQ